MPKPKNLQYLYSFKAAIQHAIRMAEKDDIPFFWGDIPVKDGSHKILAALEKKRGRPLSLREGQFVYEVLELAKATMRQEGK